MKKIAFIFFIVLISGVIFYTHTSAQSCPLAKQQSYKSPNSPAVYYITEDCAKRAFKRAEVFFTYFDSWKNVKITSQAILNSIPNDSLGFMPWGPKYDPKYGALVKTVNNPKVYLLLGSEKYWITSENVFNSLNYSWIWIEDVDQRLLDKYQTASEINYTDHHPNYTLIKYADNPKVYRLEPDPTDPNKQVKKHIKNEAEFNALGFRWDRIVTIDKNEFYQDAGAQYVLEYEPRWMNTFTKPIQISVCMMPWTKGLLLPSANYLKKYFSQVNAYLNEISLGSVYLKKVQLAYPTQTWSGALPKLFSEEEKIAQQLCDQLIDFSNVDLFIVFPSAVAGRGGASASYMDALQTNEKQLDSRILIGHYDNQNGYINHFTLDDFGYYLFVHEIMHTKLMNSVSHDGSLECGDKSFKSFEDCTIIEYGNRFSALSDNVGDFSAWAKYQAGPWISINNVIKSGQYKLAAVEVQSNQPQLIRLPNLKHPLCLEYRKPIGLDNVFATESMIKQGLPGGLPQDGCLFVSICDGKKSYLLDATPNSQIAADSPAMTPAEQADFYDSRDACLLPGKNFNSPELGVAFSYSINGADEAVNVQIDIGNYP